MVSKYINFHPKIPNRQVFDILPSTKTIIWQLQTSLY